MPRFIFRVVNPNGLFEKQNLFLFQRRFKQRHQVYTVSWKFHFVDFTFWSINTKLKTIKKSDYLSNTHLFDALNACNNFSEVSTWVSAQRGNISQWI